MTRGIAGMHDTWDSPHLFITLHWDGQRLDRGSVALIPPDVHPDSYPARMTKIASNSLKGEHADTLYAFALQIEGWGVVPPDTDASAFERKRFLADQRGRRLHARPDAVEFATTFCADVHGRLWSATQRRDRDGLQESFHEPGDPGRPGGRFVRALLSIAVTTGVVVHDLPVPDVMDEEKW
ncbi:hypothetical protein AGRA3207_007504 [Actinomadura graeca]|uniref:Uncharacterized protein n=1 Tax=Actinomadura graeca TaxID=2750812 RepID=A0ABX8R4E6_9ACTN|nr:hypothetical protein [Actinomadura graeca]QXJ25935.1 hypothetical protein AGRA3207_007504 [Actinomadura graeca]